VGKARIHIEKRFRELTRIPVIPRYRLKMRQIRYRMIEEEQLPL
jgi:hypothetical protein